uniref:Na(+)/H(+) antiporter NhaA n=1 Tax=Roseihalotalea indica TaxID=2867963 RepID=A0AA49GKE4_9BACT|nr:Na+/H+ antiporter NhaA [Tunicatimonas sp. TK19036]
MSTTVKEESGLSYIRRTATNFLDRETAGGLALIAATIVALILGNSPWAETYHHYLKNEFFFEFTDYFEFGLTLEEWVNDGLMVIFFLVAGMELKRELMVGELSSLRKASTPLLAALGGMIFPALIFVAFNAGSENIDGWGIPMATDIAYSLGIIGLLGKRVPAELKVFLVALAIADDIGAILVIAFFYSDEISWLFLGLGGATFVALMAINLFGVKRLIWFVLGGCVLWYFFLNSGVHPTIAGVLFALTIPIRPKMDSRDFRDRVQQNINELDYADLEHLDPIEDKKQKDVLDAIQHDTKSSRPPLLRLENALTGFNAFFIIPLFAIVNAGVKLDLGVAEIVSDPLGLGIILGLVLGKVSGISLFSFAGSKLGIAQLPESLRFTHIIGMGLIAGIGFTMSLFITNLAFTDEGLIQEAKIGILIASLVAAIAGMLTLVMVKPKHDY